jgi:hypothetical protein
MAQWVLDIDDPFEDAIDMYFVERSQDEATECRYFSLLSIAEAEPWTDVGWTKVDCKTKESSKTKESKIAT